MREQLSVEDYVEELLCLVAVDDRCETMPVAESLGRVLAREAVSESSIPVFDNSAMDGYAVRWFDVEAAPTRLRLVGDVPAGSDADPIAAPGECVRIMTGAALPTFADTVVPVEQTEDEGADVVILEAPARRVLTCARLARTWVEALLWPTSGRSLPREWRARSLPPGWRPSR
jgi:molybdopterin molybdotransferase